MTGAGFDVVLIAGPQAGGEAEAAVALAGGRIVARLDWTAADGSSAGADGIGMIPGRPVLAIEVPVNAPAAALATVATAVEARGLELVAVLDEAAIDLVAAALMGPQAQLLCAPTLAERVAALAVAARRSGGSAAPSVRESEAERLRRLNEEVARIARLLADLSDPGERHDGDTVEDRRATFATGPAAAAPPIAAATVRQAIRARRLRDRFFPAAIFEDPAWDILLDLFAAELESVQVSVSSLCIAAAVAPTTALRWVARMTDLGLLVRTADASDRRRAFVTLSDTASTAMRGYAAARARAGLSLG